MKYLRTVYYRIIIRWVFLAIFTMVIAGCSSTRSASEGSLVVTRKYVGNFLDYRLTDDAGPLAPDIYWIKTTLEGQYGKIGVYAKGEMNFSPLDRLYLRRYAFQNPAMTTWEYRLESSNQEIFYIIYGTSIDSSRKAAINRLFGSSPNGE
jgi:hypothetical protein